MEERRKRRRSSHRLVANVACLFFIVMAVLSAAYRSTREVSNSDWRATAMRWPLDRSVDRFHWVEQRTRGRETVGWLELEGAPQGPEHEILAARLRQAVSPTWMLQEPAPVTLVVFGKDRDPAQVRSEIEAFGFESVSFRPQRSVAVASRAATETVAPSEPERPCRDRWRSIGILVGVALVPALFARRGRDGRAFYLTLIGTPFALALASAVADATPWPVTMTWGGFLLFEGAWVFALRAWSAASPAWTPLEERRTWGFRWVAGTAAVFGAATLLLRMGLRPDGMIDAVAMYNMRARAILLDPDFWGPFRPPVGVHAQHPDYPPAVPFAIAGGYRLVGAQSCAVPIWVQLCVWAGATGLSFGWARRMMGRTGALVMLLMMAVLPHWLDRVTDQCCDVLVGMVFMAALAVWHSPARHGLRAHRTVSSSAVVGLLMGAALLTKNEGGLFLVAWFGAMVCVRGRSLRREGRQLAAVLLGLLPAALLSGWFAAHVPSNDVLYHFDWGHASAARSAEILRWFGAATLWPGSYAWVFVIVAMGAVLTLATDRHREANVSAADGVGTLALTLLAVAMGYGVIYLTGHYDVTWWLSTSIDRLFAQLFPTTLLLGVAVAAHLSTGSEQVVILQPAQRVAKRAGALEPLQDPNAEPVSVSVGR